jgi:hypothetical protein
VATQLLLLNCYPCRLLQVIVSPSYLQFVLGKRAYLRHRTAIVCVALLAYVLHPGGGLYRDAVMALSQDGLGALNLFVRLLVGSRTLFWLILRCGRAGACECGWVIDKCMHVGCMLPCCIWQCPSKCEDPAGSCALPALPPG